MSIVAIVRGEDYEEMVREALGLLGGLNNIISGKGALIKPNLGIWGTKGIPRWINRMITTKPELVAALIKVLKEAGLSDIAVGDGAVLDMDSSKQLVKSGFKKVVEATGGRVIDLDREGHYKIECGEKLTLEISKPVIETENLINVPVIKTHGFTKVTLGMKNLKGVISKKSKKAMHRRNLEHSIALLCSAVRPKLTIVDALIGLEGLGPSVWGKPVKLGLLIAGTDPVSADAIAANIMGQEPRDVEHIKIAWELGLGEIEMDKIEVRGVPLNEASHPFEPAQLGFHHALQRIGTNGVRYFGWKPGDPSSECSGCIDTLFGGLWALFSDVSKLQKPLDIVIGHRDIPIEAGDNVLLYGSCQTKNRANGTWVRGCPPTILNAYMSIAKMALSRSTFTLALTKRLLKGYQIKHLPEWDDYREIVGD